MIVIVANKSLCIRYHSIAIATTIERLIRLKLSTSVNEIPNSIPESRAVA